MWAGLPGKELQGTRWLVEIDADAPLETGHWALHTFVHSMLAEGMSPLHV